MHYNLQHQTPNTKPCLTYNFNSYTYCRQSLSFRCSLSFISFLRDLSSLFFQMKSFVTLTPVIIFSFPLSSQALSVVTNSVIHGSAPYLSIDGGQTKVEGAEDLLSITLSDGTVIKPTQDTSSSTNPIILPNLDERYSNIKTHVPLPSQGNVYYPKIDFNDLARPPFNYFYDDDGDGFDDSNGDITVTATGEISVVWAVRNRTVERENSFNSYTNITEAVRSDPDSVINACHGPYRLTISVSDNELNTTYGEPKASFISSDSHTYYFQPSASAASVCNVQPNLVPDALSASSAVFEFGDLWEVVGPLNGPRAARGYQVMKLNNDGDYQGQDSMMRNNFPSTGSHGLYFYMVLSGITPEEALAVNGRTVSAVEGGNVSLLLSAGTTEKWEHTFRGPASTRPYGVVEPALKVQLVGPRYNSADKSFRPVTFRLYADRSKRNLLYEFKLMRWYIVQPGVTYGNERIRDNSVILSYQEQAKNYCRSLGNYHLPEVNELTTANDRAEGWTGGISDGGLESYYRSYKRQLSYQDGDRWMGGIFNEWGCLVNGSNVIDSFIGACHGYSESDWDSYWYLTANNMENRSSRYNGRPLVTNSAYGRVFYYGHYSGDNRAVCVSP
ncbi:hypothetical protein H3T80_01295 [Gilliamella sp. W8145]|uniref:hypothetical protein n=1 Tax=Gilliamella sp. W8145 TaxID=2750990 RepID=UPI0018DD2B4C|nr:hypothetical protein [Gilliamella sp. W8145]MBI0102792.1 hypothetical protein [Gilliamella sp. W8145]